jgi:ribosomal protein L37AE/L43A
MGEEIIEEDFIDLVYCENCGYPVVADLWDEASGIWLCYDCYEKALQD